MRRASCSLAISREKMAEGMPTFDGGVLGNVESQSGLAHGRTAGDDDQVRGLKARGQLVQFGETRWNSGDELVLLVESFDGLKAGFDNIFEGVKRRPDPVLRDFEDGALGLIQEIIYIARYTVYLADNFRCAIDELSGGWISLLRFCHSRKYSPQYLRC